MSSRSDRVRRCPRVEGLEARIVQNAAPINTIDAAVVQIDRERPIADARLAVRPADLTPGKSSTIVGLSASPTPGSTLRPRLLPALGPDGTPISTRQGISFGAGRSNQALAYARVARPGTLTSQVAGQQGTTGSALATAYLPGDVDGSGTVDRADQQKFQLAFLSTTKDAFYTPSADANRNGFIGHGDVKFLLRNTPPLTAPKVPLQVDLALAPGQYAQGVKQEDSGGITRLTKVTVVGRTTPRSAVFSDSGLGDYTFNGPMTYADDNGDFSFNFTLDPEDRLKNTEYLVIDPYGHQTIRAFPILLID